MDFNKLPTKRIVFILLIASFISFTCYAMVADKTMPTEFVDVVKMVATFYFGVTVGEKIKNKE